MPLHPKPRERAPAERANGQNHAGSRYGTAPEDRPDLDPEVEPAVKADVRPEDVPASFAGALAENRGEDPAEDKHAPQGRGATDQRRQARR